MPTYEYICQQCGQELEIFQSITAAPLKKCPSCKKKSLVRKIGSGAALIFKGSGFYQTDYRSKEYKQKEKQERTPEKTGKHSDAKTEHSSN